MSLMFCIMFVILTTSTLRSVIMFLQHKTNFSTFTVLAHVIKLELSICTAVSNYSKIGVNNLLQCALTTTV